MFNLTDQGQTFFFVIDLRFRGPQVPWLYFSSQFRNASLAHREHTRRVCYASNSELRSRVYRHVQATCQLLFRPRVASFSKA